jgi:trehalose synthase-fused probable maltokinase
VKTRHHGDYHLGQVLNTGTDWMIIDFEGEPMRSLEERRAKRSPLRDVAGMLRSFHYAAHASRDGDGAEALERAEAWANAAREAFLERYLATAGGAPFLPGVAADRDVLLDAFIVEKALYEIDYELNNRPAWLPIPLRGFLAVMR